MKKEFTDYEKEDIERIFNGDFYAVPTIERLRGYLGIVDMEKENDLLKDEIQQLKTIDIATTVDSALEPKKEIKGITIELENKEDWGLTDKEKEKWLKEIGVKRNDAWGFSLICDSKHRVHYSREYIENTNLEELKKEHEKIFSSKNTSKKIKGITIELENKKPNIEDEMDELRSLLISKVKDGLNNPNAEYDEFGLTMDIVKILFNNPPKIKAKDYFKEVKG